MCDVNADGRPDIVAVNGNTAVGGLLGQAGGNFAAAVAFPVGSVRFVDKVALGDMNREGRPDIMTTNFAAHAASVLLGQADGGFGAATSYQSGALNAVTDVALGDVSGDGRPDIIGVNYNHGTVSVLLDTGTYIPLASAQPATTGFTITPNPAHDTFKARLPPGTAPRHCG